MHLGHAEIERHRGNHADDDGVLPPFEDDAENVPPDDLELREQRQNQQHGRRDPAENRVDRLFQTV